jgi:hypothetical protein
MAIDRRQNETGRRDQSRGDAAVGGCAQKQKAGAERPQTEAIARPGDQQRQAGQQADRQPEAGEAPGDPGHALPIPASDATKAEPGRSANRRRALIRSSARLPQPDGGGGRRPAARRAVDQSRSAADRGCRRLRPQFKVASGARRSSGTAGSRSRPVGADPVARIYSLPPAA